MRGTTSADDQLRAFLDTEGDVRFDAVTLTLCGKRAKHSLRVGRVADDDGSHDLRNCVDDLVVTLPWHEYTSERRADLSRMIDARGYEALQESIELDVIGDDAGRFSAELERNASNALATDAHNSPASGSAAGERDLVDAGVPNKVFSRFASGGNDADHTFGELCGFERFGEHHRAHRPLWRWLEHDGASGRERGRELHGRARHGRVPRDDSSDDADRHANQACCALGRLAYL